MIAIVLAAVTASSVAASGRVASSDSAREANTPAFTRTITAAPDAIVSLHQEPVERRVTGEAPAYTVGPGAARGAAPVAASGATVVSSGTSSSSSGSDVQNADPSEGGADGADDHKKINWHRKYCDKTRDDLVENGPEAEEALDGLCDPGAGGSLPGLPDGADVLAATPRPGWSNIFNFDGTTVYFFYVDVLLSQDGITSARTIEVPMTLESGAWTPSDIDIQADGLEFVQSVEF